MRETESLYRMFNGMSENTLENNMLMNPNSSRQQAIIARQKESAPDNPMEDKITGLIRDQMLSSEWAKEIFGEEKKIIAEYLKGAKGLIDQGNTAQVFPETQDTLRTMAEMWKSRIVSGAEFLDDIPQGTPAFAVANHIGTFKLLGFEDGELGEGFEDMGIPVLHPFPAFFAPLMPIADKMGDTLHQAALAYPEPVESIQRAAGSVIFAPGEKVPVVIESTQKTVDQYPNALITIFPEGGTSGKRNNAGPYALDSFKTGSFVTAAELELPIIPVCQYFNPEKGFEIAILQPRINIRKFQPGEDGKPTVESKEYYDALSQRMRYEMQAQLNKMQGEEAITSAK